jgi:steroid delta-isomerase-like uncharacterized protein
MSADDNKRVNERWIEAFNAQDWAAEAACRTSDYTAHMSGAPVPLDAAGWSGFMGSICAAFPDARIAIEDAVADGDMVASRWTLTATHRGDFQGVPPTGRRVTMRGVDFSRVVDGRIAEHWAQFDLLAVMQQIGALPAPA